MAAGRVPQGGPHTMMSNRTVYILLAITWGTLAVVALFLVITPSLNIPIEVVFYSALAGVGIVSGVGLYVLIDFVKYVIEIWRRRKQ